MIKKMINKIFKSRIIKKLVYFRLLDYINIVINNNKNNLILDYFNMDYKKLLIQKFIIYIIRLVLIISVISLQIYHLLNCQYDNNFISLYDYRYLYILIIGLTLIIDIILTDSLILLYKVNYYNYSIGLIIVLIYISIDKFNDTCCIKFYNIFKNKLILSISKYQFIIYNIFNNFNQKLFCIDKTKFKNKYYNSIIIDFFDFINIRYFNKSYDIRLNFIKSILYVSIFNRLNSYNQLVNTFYLSIYRLNFCIDFNFYVSDKIDKSDNKHKSKLMY